MLGELQIIQYIQAAFAEPWAQAVIRFCARWLIFIFALLAAMTSFVRHRPRRRHAAFEAAWSALLALTLSLLLSQIVSRLRPFQSSPLIHLWIPPPVSVYAFPSAHASVAFAVAAAFAFGDTALGVLAFLLALAVAFARVAAGVHYPTDVAAGALLGLLAFACVRFFHRQIRKCDMRTITSNPS